MGIGFKIMRQSSELSFNRIASVAYHRKYKLLAFRGIRGKIPDRWLDHSGKTEVDSVGDRSAVRSSFWRRSVGQSQETEKTNSKDDTL